MRIVQSTKSAALGFSFYMSATFAGALTFSDASQFLNDTGQPAFLAQGIIEQGDAEQLAALLDATKGTKTVLFVSSDGGNVEAAFQLAEVISEHGNIRLNVVNRCASACATIVIPAARTSELLLGARLGFHSCHMESTGQPRPECNERIAQLAVEHGFPYGAVMMWTQNVPADEIVWVRYPIARCYGYYRRDGDPVPIEQEQPCVRGIMRTMSVPLGPHYYEAVLISDCREPSGNTEFMLCREPELQGMAALLQRLYEIALSHMTEGEQLEMEHEQIEWAEGMIADCPADGLLEEILADRERAREPVRCLADNLYERIGALDTLLNNLR